MGISNRIERLERLQGLLKASDSLTAVALARELQVSIRSIWRDLDLLRSMGVPIEADRGRGGGIRLARRWSLGRLNLDEEEAVDILLSIALAESLRLPLLLDRLQSIGQKLAAAFSDAQQARIRALRRRVFIGAPASPRVVASYRVPTPATLRAVKAAFFEMRRLQMSYIDEAERTTTREVEPQFLYLNSPVWYLLAWDHLRDDVRYFRIDRIRSVEMLASTFRLRDPAPFLAGAEAQARSL